MPEAPSTTHLVLAPAPDVAAERELLLVELVPGENKSRIGVECFVLLLLLLLLPGEHVVELVHRQVDDLADGERDADVARLALVARLTDPEGGRVRVLLDVRHRYRRLQV